MASNNLLSVFHVLIVDDDKMIQRLVFDVLLNLGFSNITAAKSGREAIGHIAKNKFDFIITDWQMPDMDGIDVVHHVRRSPDMGKAAIPIIMLTANTEAKYVMAALKAGINGYLIKPFSAEQLVRRIRTVIEHPRQFIISPDYRGPDRRYSDQSPPDGIERRNSRKSPSKAKDTP